MGASDSMPLPRYSCCILPQNPDHCRENHARAPSSRRRKRCRMRWSLRSRRSDARLVDGDVNVDCYDEDPLYGRLDINTATAEGLMTLPGVNRVTATNVVTYRAHIGGFRKVEDVALVPGVGATRFGHLQAEIYVSDSSLLPPASSALRRSGSSATSSGIDVSLTPGDSVSRDFMAAVSCLQTTSSTSATLDNTDDACLRPDRPICRAAESDVVRADGRQLTTLTTESLHHRRLRRCCPPTSELRRPEDSGAVRVATWNLWPCSSDALDDVAVRELVAMTLLDTFVGIVAVQGLMDPVALYKLCHELNSPTAGDVVEWTHADRQRHWKCIVCPSSFQLSHEPSGTHYVGFIYDTSQNIELTVSTQISQLLFTGSFKIGSEELTVVIWCLPALRSHDCLADSRLSDAFSNVFKDNKLVLLVGVIGCISYVKERKWLGEFGFSTVLNHDDQLTSEAAHNETSTYSSGHIWLSPQLQACYTGKSEIAHESLTSPAAVNGCSVDGQSRPFSHCPAWTEIQLEATGLDS